MSPEAVETVSVVPPADQRQAVPLYNEVPAVGQSEMWWSSWLGTNYAWIYRFTPEQLDEHWIKNWKVPRSGVTASMLKDVPKTATILEVGCSVGNQLTLLDKMGFKNLLGVEINPYAAGYAAGRGFGVKVGTARDTKFPTQCADVTMTCAVMSHILRAHLDDCLRELARMSRKWVWMTEYCGTRDEKEDFCWCDDYAAKFLAVNPDFELVKFAYLEPDHQGLATYLFKRRAT